MPYDWLCPCWKNACGSCVLQYELIISHLVFNTGSGSSFVAFHKKINFLSRFAQSNQEVCYSVHYSSFQFFINGVLHKKPDGQLGIKHNRRTKNVTK
jgi:hypothetical protein